MTIVHFLSLENDWNMVSRSQFRSYGLRDLPEIGDSIAAQDYGPGAVEAWSRAVCKGKGLSEEQYKTVILSEDTQTEYCRLQTEWRSKMILK